MVYSGMALRFFAIGGFGLLLCAIVNPAIQALSLPDLPGICPCESTSAVKERIEKWTNAVMLEHLACKTANEKACLTKPDHPKSCKEILDRSPGPLLSGFYNVTTLSDRRHGGNATEVYCEMERYGGGWTRIANIDHTQRRCPGALQHWDLFDVNMCTRRHSDFASCDSATFDSIIGQYKEVMGFVTGYSYQTVDAFYRAANRPIDSYYVDGVSITRGSPMEHIWTYAASHYYPDQYVAARCSCSEVPGNPPPVFVGSHYYCGDGGGAPLPWSLAPADHVWSNSSVCSPGGTCCANPDMPWFHRQLPASTDDSVQLRICADEGSRNEDIGIDAAALFVR